MESCFFKAKELKLENKIMKKKKCNRFMELICWDLTDSIKLLYLNHSAETNTYRMYSS